MGELGAFLRDPRVDNPERDPAERVHDFGEFVAVLPEPDLARQGARCMECGVPFCHNGCPVGNLIPDWNDLVYRGRWREAIDQLHFTNNFPEFTGKLCPAPCEAACVLEIREGDAVTIKQIEHAIVNRAFDEGWVVPQPPAVRTGYRVAVVGAGPAGLAAAQQLNRAGHWVTVYERDEAAGGLVRFGVPDFKIEKWVIERRVAQLRDEGVRFAFGVDMGPRRRAGGPCAPRTDAVVVATGSRVPRDLPVPGRELDGVHFAMDYLYDRARCLAASAGSSASSPRATAHRGRQARHRRAAATRERTASRTPTARGAASVTQIELLGEPARAASRRPHAVARWPVKLRHELRAQGGRRARLRDLHDAS
jgi:glutamate synthase (NADPH/NADH) small chain